MDGLDVAVLARADTQVLTVDALTDLASKPTIERRLRRLTEWGLLKAYDRPPRARIHYPFDTRTTGACHQTVESVPNVRGALPGAAGLAALAAATPQSLGGVHHHEVAGISRRAWGDAVQRLHEAGLVLRKGRAPPSLNLHETHPHWLQRVYRRLYERPPPDMLGSGTATPRVVYQFGTETAWASEASPPDMVSNASLVGPTTGDAPWDTLRLTHALIYLGARRLDRLDHAWLLCASERGRRVDPGWVADGQTGPSTRVKALVFALTDADTANSDHFQQRATLYGVQDVAQEARELHRRADHPLWPEVRRMRKEFGVEEGYLAG